MEPRNILVQSRQLSGYQSLDEGKQKRGKNDETVEIDAFTEV